MESSFSILVIITIDIIIFINIVIIIIIFIILCRSRAVLLCRVEGGAVKATRTISQQRHGRGRAEQSKGQKHKWAFYPLRPRCPGQPDPGPPAPGPPRSHTQPQTQSQIITCSQVLWCCSMGSSIDTISRGRLCVWEMEAYITSSETWLLPRQRRGGGGGGA